MHLITYHNHKILKTNVKQQKYLTAILHLASWKLSGYNVCPKASVGCRTQCLFYSGFGRYKYTQERRIKKTKLLYENRPLFKELLIKDLTSLNNRAKKLGKKPVCRLNGTSDIFWEKLFPDIFTQFSHVQFYNYTKRTDIYDKFLEGKLPSNSHYIFSRSETNEQQCLDYLKKGGIIAVVFHEIPKKWHGYTVFDGVSEDLRFLSKPSTVCGLVATGRSRHDKTGFVI